MGLLRLQKQSAIPKYKQIVSSIEDAIVSGILKKDDKLLSFYANHLHIYSLKLSFPLLRCFHKEKPFQPLKNHQF